MVNFGFCPNKQSQYEYVLWKTWEKIEYSACKASCEYTPEILVWFTEEETQSREFELECFVGNWELMVEY